MAGTSKVVLHVHKILLMLGNEKAHQTAMNIDNRPRSDYAADRFVSKPIYIEYTL